jgi:hypothetical protein
MEQAVDWYSVVLGTAPDTSPTCGHCSVWATPTWRSTASMIWVKGTKVELSLVATEAFEIVVERLTASDIPIERGIQEETFGRSVVLKDPKGPVIQVNEQPAEKLEEPQTTPRQPHRSPNVKSESSQNCTRHRRRLTREHPSEPSWWIR